MMNYLHKRRMLYGYLGILLLFFSIASTAFASVPITFLPQDQWTDETDQYGQENDRIKDIINEELLLDDTVYMEAKVKILFDDTGRKSSLIIYMLHRDNYSIDTARIDLDDNLIPVNTELDYVEPPETLQDSSAVWATCPDDSVQMVFSSMETKIPTAIKAVDKAAEIAGNKGFKVKVLKGDEENKDAIKNWLSCSSLILYGRVGHGNEKGIMLDDGMLSYHYFKSLSQTALNHKVLYFNSCKVHNDPLKSSIVNAGVQKYIGGVTNLKIGPSEEVFKCWNTKVVSQNKKMTPSLAACEELHPRAGEHGISGNGSDLLSTGNQPPPPPPATNELENNKPRKNLSGTKDSWLYYKFKVPADAKNLKISISGGSGDADLYTRFGAKPTESKYDCRPWTDGNDETCGSVAAPEEGYYYIGINGYESFTGVTLVARYEKATSGDDKKDELQNDKAKKNLAASEGEWLYYKIKIPAGAGNLKFSISGGDGDADLYTRYGAKPTESKYDCRPWTDGNDETCGPITRPKTGYYYVGINAYESFSGVSLVARYSTAQGYNEETTGQECLSCIEDMELDIENNTFQ